MILHTINKPAAWQQCHELIAADDAVLLIEDGVYLALENPALNCYVLEADASARGLEEKLGQSVSLATYSDFVRLSLEAEKVCAWF